MNLLVSVISLCIILQCAYAPPVSPDNKDEDVGEDQLAEYTEYHRYLKEVVQALESDPEFRDRLEKANEDDVRSGKIAEQLDFVNHNVRTKLDEIKRRELERLRHLATKKFELTNNLDVDSKVSNEHLDHNNPHTFEIEDLKKLIQKTTADLEAADKKRKEQFKEYEMQKEFEKHQKLEELDETQKKEYLENIKKEEEAKKHHQPLHHPGSKQQLEEVWDKQDHMDQQFDPKAFFMMHDVDGNGVWDADEVKALFIKELDKIYTPNGPNKDLHERAEEMERMREHVFKENDKNKDGLIDFHEFMMETQRAEFNQDEGWKSIDENQIYTQAEYEVYERRRQDEMRYLQQRGLVDAHGRPLPGAEHQIHLALQQKQAMEQQMYAQHQQQYQSHYPPGQFQQGQPQFQQGQQYQQVPQQGQQYQQVPQQGQQFQQVPQQGQQYQQVPQQGQQYQQAQQGQQYQQIPQQGQQYQQVPPGQPQQHQQQGQFQVQPPQVQNLSPGQTIPAQGQAPIQQAQGQNQGQISQGQIPQGQVPQQVSQGQIPQGQIPQQVPQGQISQGQVPQQVTQGQVPQGQVLPGQAPQAYNPSQGQAPPSVVNH